jgi:hypothetical protein
MHFVQITHENEIGNAEKSGMEPKLAEYSSMPGPELWQQVFENLITE